MSEVARERKEVDIDSKDWKAKRREQMKAELRRQAKEAEDARQHAAIMRKREAQRAEQRQRTAAGLKPAAPDLQEVVEGKLTERTTKQLMQVLRYVALRPRSRVVYVSTDAQLARDVMQRAYPMALAMGLMARCQDQDTTLRLSNGSWVDFRWPDKPEVPA